MFNPSYLTLSRHNIFYFRFPIPALLNPDGQKSEIRLSLGTRDPKRALQIARKLAYFGQGLMHSSGPVEMPMDYHQIRRLLKNYFQNIYRRMVEEIDAYGPFDPAFEARMRNLQAESLKALRSPNSPVAEVNESIDYLIGSLCLPIQKGSGEYKLFHREYLRADSDCTASLIQYSKRVAQYDFGERPTLRSRDGFTYPPQLNAARTGSPAPAEKKLMVPLINVYVQEKLRLKEWTEKTAAGVRSAFDLLLEYLGKDTPVDITASRANAVKRMLMGLPKRIRTNP